MARANDQRPLGDVIQDIVLATLESFERDRQAERERRIFRVEPGESALQKIIDCEAKNRRDAYQAALQNSLLSSLRLLLLVATIASCIASYVFFELLAHHY